MNKKTYMQPTVAETIVRMDAMILAVSGESLQFSSDGESGSGNLNDEEAEGDGLSRRHTSLWDD